MLGAFLCLDCIQFLPIIYVTRHRQVLRGAQHCLIQNLKNNIDLCLKFPMSPVGKKGGGGIVHSFMDCPFNSIYTIMPCKILGQRKVVSF